MRTPDGRECPYYAVSYHRRTTPQETCHLLEGERRWHSGLCARCPVPDIRRANACPYLVLHACIRRVHRWRFWEPERVLVHATCRRSGDVVSDPYVGCGLCHTPLQFVVAEGEPQTDA